MAGIADQVQARISEVRSRMQSVRPNLLPKFTAGVQQRVQGLPILRQATQRVQGLTNGPILRGLISGGVQPAQAGVSSVSLPNGGFRSEPAVSAQVDASGYRFTT